MYHENCLGDAGSRVDVKKEVNGKTAVSRLEISRILHTVIPIEQTHQILRILIFWASIRNPVLMREAFGTQSASRRVGTESRRLAPRQMRVANCRRRSGGARIVLYTRCTSV